MSKNIKAFYAFDDIQSQNYYAESMPKGRLTGKRFDNNSNFYKMIFCIADFIKQITAQLFSFAKNLDINQTDELLTEWETSVNIPKNIPQLSTVANRQVAVQQLISKIPVYNYQGLSYSEIKTTIENYVLVITGIVITITFLPTGVPTFPLVFPYTFLIPPNAQFLVFVINVQGQITQNYSFPLIFPVNYYSNVFPPEKKQILDLILPNIIPSFCTWQYNVVA